MSGTRPLIAHLAIIGMGLIGSSLARAVRQAGLAASITAIDADDGVRAACARLGLADHVTADAGQGVQNADLVMLATPVGCFEAIAKAIAPQLKPGAIVSDVGSVKGQALAAIGPHLPAGVHLVPGHPVAGTEQSGPEAGFAALFHGRWSILTPAPGTDEAAIAAVRALWEGVGAKVELMSAAHHDLVLAITSHVPHLIAFNIVGTASHLEEVTRSEVIKYSAGGFRDFTRIAASDPTMWRDVFLANRDAVLEMLGRFTEDLTALQRAIRFGDGDALYDLFSRTRDIRRRIIDEGQDAPMPDFGRPHE